MPAKITTPDTAETRIGTLRFKDGAPDAATVQLAYDQLDFGRGVDAFLKGMSATSVYALCRGLEAAGIETNRGIGISEDLLDARSLFLTPNTTTVYVLACLNLNLRGTERRGAERACGLGRSGYGGPVRRHRHPQGSPIRARRTDEEDPHRVGGRGECDRTR
ncbi:hypothetical protein [uncultured Lamprocystis sp.]|uniref:hypothetical protein n=1 Tax=uncultured Lamprocystis sp. TaxID=543132 RepID=UPI0025D119DC|nr:hypothetical protein [uncultured Lamprocystis sp.]